MFLIVFFFTWTQKDSQALYCERTVINEVRMAGVYSTGSLHSPPQAHLPVCIDLIDRLLIVCTQ